MLQREKFREGHAVHGLAESKYGIERIKPGHPQQNGRHVRMHLTLKEEATKPAAANFLQQQARFARSSMSFFEPIVESVQASCK